MRDFNHAVAKVPSSGIRRVFELGAKLADPINLSIGQPDFPVPEAIKEATIEAIRAKTNAASRTTAPPSAIRIWVGVDRVRHQVMLWDACRGSGQRLRLQTVELLPGDRPCIEEPLSFGDLLSR